MLSASTVSYFLIDLIGGCSSSANNFTNQPDNRLQGVS